MTACDGGSPKRPNGDWLVASSWLLPATLLMTAGDVPGEGELSNMDTKTKENSIKMLKELRDAYQSQLDASVIAEIEVVITALEKGCDCSDAKPSKDWGLRVLTLIADVLRLVTNISDLMK